MPTPKLPWYQFSLRSLLLFTLFVAILCSIGVSLDWVVAGMLGVGGVVGRITARKKARFSVGETPKTLLGVLVICVVGFCGLLVFVYLSASGTEAWSMEVLAVVVALVGVILGAILVV